MGSDLRSTRAWGLVGTVVLAVTGVVIVLAPVVLIAAGAAIGALLVVGRDPDVARLRFGIALLAAGLVTTFNLVTGQLALVLPAATATGCLFVAWRRCEQLHVRRRRSWGVVQRDRLARQQALHDRRDRLRERPRGLDDR